MTINEAGWDRISRVVLGVAPVALVFVGPQTPWGWVGLLFIGTGAVGTCPLYSLFGFSTCPAPKRP